MWRDRVAHCSNPSDGSQFRVRVGALRSSSSLGVARYGPKKGDGGSGSVCGVVGDGGRGSRENMASVRVSQGLCEHAALAFCRTILLSPHLIRSTLASAPVGFWCPQAERRSWTPEAVTFKPEWRPEAGAPRSFLASGRHSGLTGRLLVSRSGARLWGPEAVTLDRFAFPCSGAAFPCFEVPPSFCACAGKAQAGASKQGNAAPEQGNAKRPKVTASGHSTFHHFGFWSQHFPPFRLLVTALSTFFL